MALAVNAFVSLSTAKDHLQIPPLVVNQDSRIERMVNTASAMIESYTNRSIVSKSIIEHQDGRSSNKILLNQYPFVTGPATGGKPRVWIDGLSNFNALAEVDPESYYVDKEIMIIRISGIFPKGYRNIKLEYTAGLGLIDALPADITWACLELVAWYYNTSSNHRIGVISQGKLGENVNFEQLLPKHIELLLQPYVRFEFPDASVGVRNS